MTVAPIGSRSAACFTSFLEGKFTFVSLFDRLTEIVALLRNDSDEYLAR